MRNIVLAIGICLFISPIARTALRRLATTSDEKSGLGGAEPSMVILPVPLQRAKYWSTAWLSFSGQRPPSGAAPFEKEGSVEDRRYRASLRGEELSSSLL